MPSLLRQKSHLFKPKMLASWWFFLKKYKYLINIKIGKNKLFPQTKKACLFDAFFSILEYAKWFDNGIQKIWPPWRLSMNDITQIWRFFDPLSLGHAFKYIWLIVTKTMTPTPYGHNIIYELPLNESMVLFIV